MPLMEISLEDIRSATNNFSYENLIGRGGFGNVYKGKLHREERTVAIKRLIREKGQGEHQFWTEIKILSSNEHKNMITLVGFCNEGDECILVYEYVENGSLNEHLSDNELSWRQRLQISLDAARCFTSLHNNVESKYKVLHRDIKSSNILLSKEWEVKISDFGLSKIIFSNVKDSSVVTNSNVEDPIVVTNSNVVETIGFTNPCGTTGYVAPEYKEKRILTEESDVYSFGVVLFEILSGKVAYEKYQDENERLFLSSLAQKYFERKKLVEIIHPKLQTDQIGTESFKLFSMVAYNCLKEDRSKRPKMAWIVKKLEKALKLQDNKEDRSVLIGTCGREAKSLGKFWSFKLKENHRLSNITIYHGDSGIYSLMFTPECGGVLHNSEEVGRSDCGEVSQVIHHNVTIKDDEILDSIHGTINKVSKVISSLSFVTKNPSLDTKQDHGPFGRSKSSMQREDEEFCIPWGNGCLDGFYGFSGSYIYGIGVYLKPCKEILKTGTFGGKGVEGTKPKKWCSELEGNHLEKITIHHGDQIYALRFTKTEDSPLYPFGGDNAGGSIKGKVCFDLGEEIHAINGTVGLSEKVQHEDGATILTSISFVTNKTIHGPFGQERGAPFTIECEYGEFVDFYGIYGFYIDSIGVLLKTSTPKTLSRTSDN